MNRETPDPFWCKNCGEVERSMNKVTLRTEFIQPTDEQGIVNITTSCRCRACGEVLRLGAPIKSINVTVII